ncbi:MAG: radical SAM protein [Candidatus Berkelbacteria bacterium]
MVLTFSPVLLRFTVPENQKQVNDMIIPRLYSALTEQEKLEGAGKCLEMWIEVGRACDHACRYCFADKAKRGRQMTPVSYIEAINNFAVLGGKTVGVPGLGEPFHPMNRAHTYTILEQCCLKGLRTAVFTSGYAFDNEVLDRIIEWDVTLMIKFNSMRPEIQDALVATPGYTEVRTANIERLLVRLNGSRPAPEGITHVGMVTMLRPENLEEMPEIFRYCRRNGFYPDFDTELEFGRGRRLLTDEQIKQTFEELQRIDREEFDNDWEISPAYVAGHCDRCDKHLYVQYDGKVSPCLGASMRGIYVGKAPHLKYAWETDALMKKIRNREYEGECTTCQLFREHKCNSCLGRFVDEISHERINTTGCWCHKDIQQ